MEPTTVQMLIGVATLAASGGAAFKGASVRNKILEAKIQHLETELGRDVKRIERKVEHAHDRVSDHLVGHLPPMKPGG